MPRKEKFTVDYFQHDTKHGKTIYILENKYNKDGYYFWFKLLELLGSTDHHFYDCREPEDFEFLTAHTKVTNELAEQILDTLSRVKAIHPGLWEKRIIWSQKFITRLDVLYKRRENKCMNYIDLCKHLSNRCYQKYGPDGLLLDGNTHTILEDTILEDTILEDTILEDTIKEKEDFPKKLNNPGKKKEKEYTIVYPFDDPQFLNAWELWKTYKKEQFNFRYKSQITEQAALKSIGKLSGGDLNKAIAVIHQSISQAYQGLFPLKNYDPQRQDLKEFAAQTIKSMMNDKP